MIDPELQKNFLALASRFGEKALTEAYKRWKAAVRKKPTGSKRRRPREQFGRNFYIWGEVLAQAYLTAFVEAYPYRKSDRKVVLNISAACKKIEKRGLLILAGRAGRSLSANNLPWRKLTYGNLKNIYHDMSTAFADDRNAFIKQIIAERGQRYFSQWLLEDPALEWQIHLWTVVWANTSPFPGHYGSGVPAGPSDDRVMYNFRYEKPWTLTEAERAAIDCFFLPRSQWPTHAKSRRRRVTE